MSTADRWKKWLQGHKDNSVSFLLEKFVQKKIERYGRLLELKLDSAASAASLKVLLKGETEPVTIWVDQYAVSQTAGATSVTIHRASSSREWLGLLLQDFLVGKSFPVPEQYASYVRMAL